MTLCKTIHILCEKNSKNGFPSACHAVHGVISAIITTIFRVILLVFCLHLGNSIIVQLCPPSQIRANTTCEVLTVVTSYNQFTTYHKSSLDAQVFLTNLSEIENARIEYSGYKEGGSLYYADQKGENMSESINQNYLFGYGQFWFMFHTDSDSNSSMIYSYDDEGYQQYYYYCADLAPYLNTTWVPVITWFLLNIVPVMALSIIVLSFTLKSKCVLTSCTNPGMIISGILSHLHLGPVSFTKTNLGCLTLSSSITFLNILITFVGMCLNIHLTTAAFGPGDGRHLRYILPLCICIPIFLISAICGLCFLLPCCGHSAKCVYNPGHPDRWYTLDTGGNIVQEEQNMGMKGVAYTKISE